MATSVEMARLVPLWVTVGTGCGRICLSNQYVFKPDWQQFLSIPLSPEKHVVYDPLELLQLMSVTICLMWTPDEFAWFQTCHLSFCMCVYCLIYGKDGKERGRARLWRSASLRKIEAEVKCFFFWMCLITGADWYHPLQRKGTLVSPAGRIDKTSGRKLNQSSYQKGIWYVSYALNLKHRNII